MDLGDSHNISRRDLKRSFLRLVISCNMILVTNESGTFCESHGTSESIHTFVCVDLSFATGSLELSAL